MSKSKKQRRFVAYHFPNGYVTQATNMWQWLAHNGLHPSSGKTRKGGGDVIMLPERERSLLESLKRHHPARYGSNPRGFFVKRKAKRGRKAARRSKARNTGVDPIVRQIVNRCHVSDKLPKVLRYVLSRTKDKGRTFKAMPRAKRRQLLAMIQKVHADNRKIYKFATTGRW